MLYDVAIIGAGVAGSQAALTLARGNRRVLLLDAGKPRHRFASHMHNFLGSDGTTPEEFYGRIHTELSQYPHVTRLQAEIVDARRTDQGFLLDAADGARHAARMVLFATGVKDVLPPIDGLAELWGSRVLHCTYCHGYEARGKVLGVLVTNDNALGVLGIMRALSERVHFFFDGLPDANVSATLKKLGMTPELHDIEAVKPDGEGVQVALDDGRSVYCDVLFIRPPTAQNSLLPQGLGCQTFNGDSIVTNGHGKTHAPGVFVAGDAAGSVSQLMAAAASGLLAAIDMNTELDYVASA